MPAPWKKIVSRSRAKDVSVTFRGRNFTYHMVPVTTVTLECGHQHVYRGSGVPKLKIRCKLCPT